MNVYDFDGTVYDGDSTLDFYLFCLRRHPGLAACLPRQGLALLRRRVGGLPWRRAQEAFFCFVPRLLDVNAEVAAFWDGHLPRVKGWYWAQRRASDVIVSAGPAFLLEEAGRRLGVQVLATRVDARTGRLLGESCWGPEKAVRLAQAFPGADVEGFWSDSLSDAPLAALARRAFFVRGNAISPWPGAGA